MKSRSFLSAFTSVLHAMEAAATITSPIIRMVSPEVGGLMMAATQAAVGAEAAITAPSAGADRAAVVAQSTRAALDVVNQILVSQGKQPLKAGIADVAIATASVAVSQLNGIAGLVNAAPAAPPAEAPPAEALAASVGAGAGGGSGGPVPVK
jgi:hypothetical protein